MGEETNAHIKSLVEMRIESGSHESYHCLIHTVVELSGATHELNVKYMQSKSLKDQGLGICFPLYLGMCSECFVVYQ